MSDASSNLQSDLHQPIQHWSLHQSIHPFMQHPWSSILSAITRKHNSCYHEITPWTTHTMTPQKESAINIQHTTHRMGYYISLSHCVSYYHHYHHHCSYCSAPSIHLLKERCSNSQICICLQYQHYHHHHAVWHIDLTTAPHAAFLHLITDDSTTSLAFRHHCKKDGMMVWYYVLLGREVIISKMMEETQWKGCWMHWQPTK